MKKDWVAQSEWGDWTAIPRKQENPTMRERIEAAVTMREFVGYGYNSFDEFSTMVRELEPIMVTYWTGEAAMDESGGQFDEFWQENPDGDIKAWVLR